MEKVVLKEQDSKKKKVYISTYTHWKSFGSILQSLGLQYLMKSIDIEPSTIVFEVDKNRKAVEKVKIKISISYLKYLYKLLNKDKLDRGRRLSLEFIDKNINCITFYSPTEIKINDNQVSAFVAGSDQIWHPALCREDFFLKYVPNGKKKISYAASMGVTEISEKNRDDFIALLQNFDAYSVRENAMIPIIQQFVRKNVLQHIDPTFFLSSSEWCKYQKPYNICEKYILVYAIYWDNKLNKELRRLHKESGLKIISIQDSLRNIYSQQKVFDAGPSEFLWLIDHAEAVVTSSFHGTAFSIIFNKRFFPVINPKAKSRIDSLLSTLKVKCAKSIDSILSYEVDYDETNNVIEMEKRRSIEYLRKEIIDEQ